MRVCLIILLFGGSLFGQSTYYSYDKFRDHSTYSSAVRPLKPLSGQLRPSLDVFTILDTPGATHKNCTVERVKRFECSFRIGFRSTSGSWRFVRNRSIIILANDQRIFLGEGLHTSDVQTVGKRVWVIEWISGIISIDQLRQLAGAQTVEFRVGMVEGAADEATVKAFGDILRLVDDTKSSSMGPESKTVSDEVPIEKAIVRPEPTEPVSKTVSGGVLNGKAISMPKPSYPPGAKVGGASGAVAVRVLIDENGNVVSASAVSGHPLLRPAAETAAYGARFSPTVLSGQPVKVSGVLTYNFVP